jgi:crossover junction endodeoxyribonuclease RuvC
MRAILGVDCGTALVGWGVIKVDGEKVKSFTYGVIRTEKTSALPERLNIIYNELNKIIDLYGIEEMAVEMLFYFKNTKTVISVSEARGVILLSGAVKGIKQFDYTPLQVKTAVTGYGRAEKKQIQYMVQKILKMKELPKPDDAADALALAICHLCMSNNDKLS